MAAVSSKFVEILDTSNAPYSQDNVSLDDVLEATRERSESPTGSSTTDAKRASYESPTTTQPPKTRLRGFSLMKKS